MEHRNGKPVRGIDGKTVGNLNGQQDGVMGYDHAACLNEPLRREEEQALDLVSLLP